MNKLKLSHSYFTGCAYIRHEDEDKFKKNGAKIKYVSNGFYALKSFNISKKTIKVTDCYEFCGLLRFYYQKYCCVVNKNDIIYLK